mmetsp:Transcript_49704/g.120485  ORF Transcript_49704/g.120485 Transcript_49704/m.120485 type:complete len:90 (+) Transcript_49704:189-458(+)
MDSDFLSMAATSITNTQAFPSKKKLQVQDVDFQIFECSQLPTGDHVLYCICPIPSSRIRRFSFIWELQCRRRGCLSSNQSQFQKFDSRN